MTTYTFRCDSCVPINDQWDEVELTILREPSSDQTSQGGYIMATLAHGHGLRAGQEYTVTFQEAPCG